MTEELLSWMNRREKQILVHSFLYYQANVNIISDHTYDLWCRELAEAKEAHPDIFSQTRYAKEFADFDGSTGFDLPKNYPEIEQTAWHLYHYHNKHYKQ